MKKLMIALSAAAAAFFAVGTAHGAPFSSADFEASGYVVEAAFDASKGDDGVSTSGDRFWYSESNDGNVISGHVGEVTANVPDYYENAASNYKFLQLDTSAPLLRTVKANAQDPTAFEGQAIGDGIYLDTLVKFTAADQAFTDDLTDGDKIAISFVDHEAEEGGNDEAYTSFVIRAGYIAGEQVLETNYFATVPSGFNKDAWHRLTVRSLSGIDAAGHVGFVVYIDENPLAYAEGVTIGDSFTPSAGIVTDLNNARVLYPSAVNTDGTNFDKITCASFSGTGAIDDVVFTADKPSFINEASMVTVTWDTDAVASIRIAGTDITGEEFAAGTKTLVLDGNTIEVVAEPVSGYDLVFTPPENGGWDSNANTFTGLSANDVCAVTGFVPLFDVGGVHYGTIEAAVTAAQTAGTAESPAPLKMLADVATPISIDSGYVIIDLNGKTITGDGIEGGAIVNGGASIKIINSAVTIGHVAPGASDFAIVIGGGSTEIDAGSFDGLIAVDAESFTLAINGGVFYDDNYDQDDDPTTFYMKDYVGSGISITPIENNYFQVGEPPAKHVISWDLTGGTTDATSGEEFVEGSTIVFTADSGYALSFVSIGGDEIADTSVYGASSYTYTVGDADAALVVTFTALPTYELTIPEVANASATVTAGGEQVADLTAIVSNTEVVVTWAAAEGYKITDGATQTITMDSNKTADSPTVAAITYATLTITPAENCTIVVSNATEEVATDTKFDVDEAVVLTVYRTPAEGYELDGCAATEQITMNQDQTVTATVKSIAAETWTVTLTLGEHVTSVSYVFVETPETTNTLTATGSFTIEKTKSFALVDAVAEEGWEIDLEASLASLTGATIDPTSFFVTPTADASGSIIAKSSTPSGEDWATGDDLDAMSGKSVEATYGITGDLANADAKVFTTWASGVGGIAYADRTTTTYNVDCFLLNIANDSTAEQIAAAKATAAAAINITAITFDDAGKPVITAPATYGNGKVVIKGKVALTDADWAAFDDSTQHFFRAELVVDAVAAQAAPEEP